MKRLIFLMGIIFSIYGFGQSRNSKTISPPSIQLSSIGDTIQYSLGVFVIQWIKKNGFVINNSNLFKKGIEDALVNKPLAVNADSLERRLLAYQKQLQQETGKQSEIAFFAKLKTRSGIGILPSGVYYEVVKMGEGNRPSLKDSVTINAIGTLPNGAVFQDTKQNPPTLLLSGMLPGLTEVIQLMPEGSLWHIYVPSVLAYGETGLQNLIPPNTTLIFDIKLLRVLQKKGY